ncbi:MAG: DUF29 domain-containing protein [Geminicoccaceae bacterium]|nr:DUF29 domain-containing protein [Geminicoccaceae bacterium]
MSTLYEDDLAAWAEDQARALRAAARAKLNTPVAVDWENLAEEIEQLARSERRELASRLFRLLTHLAKWRWQPRRRSRSWRATIGEQRRELARLLADSPSLRSILPETVARAWADARGQAADATGLPLATFPETCPFTPEAALDPDFWPEAD